MGTPNPGRPRTEPQDLQGCWAGSHLATWALGYTATHRRRWNLGAESGSTGTCVRSPLVPSPGLKDGAQGSVARRDLARLLGLRAVGALLAAP